MKMIFLLAIIYCLYRFVWDNYKSYRVQKFLNDSDSMRLLCAMIKYVNQSEGMKIVPEIVSLEEFNNLDDTGKQIVEYTVNLILENVEAYENFFRDRGDI